MSSAPARSLRPREKVGKKKKAADINPRCSAGASSPTSALLLVSFLPPRTDPQPELPELYCVHTCISVVDFLSAIMSWRELGASFVLEPGPEQWMP